MNAVTSTRIVLASRPHGDPTFDNFRTETMVLPELSDGQVLLRTVFLSLDPYMRGRMSAAESYADPVEVGDVMVGATVSQVMESRNPRIAAGSHVLAYSGWQTHAVADGDVVRVLDPGTAPLSTALGVLGMTGFTAYSGLLKIGRPQPGETVVVAAASGPVGSAVGQIAKIHGARAVGIAGGPDKCDFVRDELGFDAAIDHRADDFRDRLAAAAPDGVDVYFENVGGPVTAAVLPLLNHHARIPLCGLVSQYNVTGPSEGPDRLPAFMGLLLTRSVTVRGFIQSEFVAEMYGDFERDASRWLADGRLKYREDVVHGLDKAPAAFIGMLHGANFGKVVVRVGPDE